MPAGVYRKNFLREYAIYLGLDDNNLIKIFSQETGSSQSAKKQEIFSKQIIKGRDLLIISKIVRSFLIIVVVCACFIYLGFCLKEIIAPPELDIIEPKDNLITSQSFINIIGVTEPEAQVIINGELILINDNGSFTKKIDLKNGINTIIITAKKKYGREEVVKKQVLFE